MNTKTAEEIKTYEIFTTTGSTIHQAKNAVDAIMLAGNPDDLICIQFADAAAQSAPLATEGREVWEWVKASERMPELYPLNNTDQLHFDLDGIKVDGYFLHSRCFEYFNNEIAGYSQIDFDDFARIEWLSRTTLPSQLEGNTLKQEGEQWEYHEVPISPDTMPKEKGWYNISSNAHPKPCGRAFFDGKNFKFTNSSATKGILEQGGKLFWLERYPSQQLGGYTLQQVGDAWDAALRRREAYLSDRTYGVPDKATYLSTLTAPIPAEREGKDAVRFGKFLREHGFQTMNGIMQNMTTTELYQRYKQYLSTLK